jgi:hypothetical protein
MKRTTSFLILASLAASTAGATDIPLRTFYSGNDVYDFCQHDRAVAFASSQALTRACPCLDSR